MPDDKSSTGTRAVFLSYSREDTEPARRIADALRAFGLEVWFDQNELRGGDSWDAKIKRQIRECTLFLPIISAHTQSRMEGYFRREWKLGVERTHDMAGGVAFITPVVIDDTLESAALVPEEFMRYQWTRLPHGVPTPEFVGQVKRLLEAPAQGAAATGHSRPPVHATGAAPRRPGPPGWAWGALVAGVVVAAAAVFYSRKQEAPPAAPKAAVEAAPAESALPANDKSIAVLPFDNMSEEKDASAFFADGVQEDILTNLSFIHDLRVVSRTSVMQYRGTIKPIRQIAKELGVTYVLEGSVRRAGNKVRVTGQLIHAATDEHVWAKAYDRDITDVFAIQAELAQSIADSLQAAISPAEQTLIQRKPTANAAAYDLFLKARAAYEANDINVMDQVSWLLDAVQLDPGFAQAWALLGALQAANHFAELDSSPEMLEKAKAAIDTAVRLAPDDPIVIEMRGDFYYYGYRDYKSAAEQYRRLQTLRPNSPEAVGSLGLIYRRMGRWDDSLAALRRSIDLDPQNQRYRTTISVLLFGLRRYTESNAEMHRVVEMTGGNMLWTFYDVAIPYYETGSVDQAKASIAQLKANHPDDPLAAVIQRNWARTIGDFAEAQRIDSRQPYYDANGLPHWQQDFDAAFDHVATGDMATARTRLEKLLPQLKAELVNEPENSGLWYVFGMTEAVLGDRAQALAAANKVVELVPESIDAVDGPGRSAWRAKILAWAGDKEVALAEFSRLLHVPYGTNVYGDRFDPGWLPLQGDPRFQALLADPKNNETIK
jgi:TolB-like protein/cytochrome c-type biogenesis protein CcmH/NrfG